MFPILLKIGPLTLHTYGLMVALGFLSGYTLARNKFLANKIPVDLLDQMVLVLMLSGILGARVFYFLLEGREEFLADPLSFFRIWEGGLVFFGGFLIGFGALFYFCKRVQLPFFKLTDMLTPSLLLAQGLGRLGCFAAGCCYGKPTHRWWGVTFTNPESLAPRFIALHPTQIYSALGDFLLFLGALWLQKRLKKPGTLFAYYLITYGFFRFLIEFVRDDYRGRVVLNLFPSQWISILCLTAGISIIHYAQKNKTERNEH